MRRWWHASAATHMCKFIFVNLLIAKHCGVENHHKLNGWKKKSHLNAKKKRSGKRIVFRDAVACNYKFEYIIPWSPPTVHEPREGHDVVSGLNAPMQWKLRSIRRIFAQRSATRIMKNQNENNKIAIAYLPALAWKTRKTTKHTNKCKAYRRLFAAVSLLHARRELGAKFVCLNSISLTLSLALDFPCHSSASELDYYDIWIVGNGQIRGVSTRHAHDEHWMKVSICK